MVAGIGYILQDISIWADLLILGTLRDIPMSEGVPIQIMVSISKEIQWFSQSLYSWF